VSAGEAAITQLERDLAAAQAQQAEAEAKAAAAQEDAAEKEKIIKYVECCRSALMASVWVCSWPCVRTHI